jgi:hypothetical protein
MLRAIFALMLRPGGSDEAEARMTELELENFPYRHLDSSAVAAGVHVAEALGSRFRPAQAHRQRRPVRKSPNRQGTCIAEARR